jgi:PleD family two-component response regulator
MSRQLHRDEAVAYGANDFIAKPVEFDDIQDTVKNMKNLSDLIIRLRDDHKDFISRDGVVSKTAFYQVFSSCLDRADRYGEETFLIFVRIDNIRDLQNFYGEERTEDICTKVKKYTVKIRRLSDIIGRTAVNELCLVVSRPMNKNEPIMAVNRFSDTLMEYADMFVDGDARAKVSVHMMAIPSGKILFSKQCYSD